MKNLYILFLLLLSVQGRAQLLSSMPNFPKETDAGVVITVDATKGNLGLKDYNPNDVYVHIGCITNQSTSPSDWKYSKFAWGTTDPAAKAVSLGNNKWSYTLTGADIRAFFGIINPSEKILKITCIFRNGVGSQKQANVDGSDMYLPIYDNTLQVNITQPFRFPTYIPVPEPIIKQIGDHINIEARSSQTANLKLLHNNVQVSALNGTSINANIIITTGGLQKIIAEAETGGNVKKDTFDFFVISPTVIEALPAGVRDGINYEAGGTAATLVLYAPNKSNIFVIGDFNNWLPGSTYQMKKTPDGSRFWLRITGLTPGMEYGYQYLIDGTTKVADYNAEKILDPDNDKYISAATYPGLKPYPQGLTTGIVSVLQTNKPQYTWSLGTFNRPDKKNLMIYELLLRDFIAKQDWKTLNDTLSYLQRLGINAIELMPFNEFEGNNSWGYNSSFYFAPDKAYGPANELKRFIDSCHRKGIAVIMDIALNHSFGQSPMVQMYWDAMNNRPALNNPWFNPVPKHAYNVGYDMNHESQATKDFVDRVTDHWLNQYKIDGFRWDLAKGFTQKQTCDNSGNNCDESAFAAYDPTRVTIWKRIYDKMQLQSPGSYCILEMFADNIEEKQYSDYGIMLWGNSNYNYNEASMGYLGNSNFEWIIHTKRGWTNPALVGYAESHDEERLMYKNLTYGNSANSAYNVKDLNIALKRQEMVAAFLLTIPGPKMIWQFGELGYDFSINRCTDGTINNNCRLSDKPIRWDYQNNPNRKALFNIYKKLFDLRKRPNLSNVWKTNNISWDLNGAFKKIQITEDTLKITVIGNFDVVPTTGTVTFQTPGIWYSYLTDTTHIATGLAENISLQPGEYYVYTNRSLNITTNPPPTQPLNNDNITLQIAPNPVLTDAQIIFDLPQNGTVNIYVYDQIGKKVGKITESYQTKGVHKIPLKGSSWYSSRMQKGKYFLRLTMDGKNVICPFLIL